MSKIMWTQKFIDNQGWEMKHKIILQDNASTIKLLNHGRESSGKITRHFDIRHFMSRI